MSWDTSGATTQVAFDRNPSVLGVLVGISQRGVAWYEIQPNRNPRISRRPPIEVGSDLPNLSVGDTIDVHQRIIEGGKERTQVFQGVLIGMKGRGINRMITVRRHRGQ